MFCTLDLKWTESKFKKTEAATGGDLYQKVLLKLSQCSQENTCVGVSF